MIENVYYINLENRSDRKTLVENELNSLGWKYQRFNAIKTKDGRVGCSMSHLKLIKMAKEKNLDYIVIVEDDIEFKRKDWYNERIKNIMDTDFDVFLLAGNLRPPIFQTNYENIVKVSKSFTTTGYIVKKHYYDKLIDNIDEGIRLLLKNPGGEFNDNAIDSYWMKLQESDKWYIVMPRTITQRPIYSDIEKRYTDYNHLMLDDMRNIPKDNCNIIKYIVPERFDLMAKYLYIKSEDKKYNTNFYKELYHKHILTFNNCYELPDPTIKDNIKKENIKDFLDSFDKLIKNIKNDDFNEKYPIPIGNNNIIINGAHRLMISYYYNKIPLFKKLNMPGDTYDFNFFKNRKVYPNLSDIYSDTMALEYIKHDENIRCMILYPTAYDNIDKFQTILNKIKEYGTIYYAKFINLNKNGISNLIKEAYRGESWIGGYFPSGFSNSGKTELCLSTNNNNVTLILISMNDISKCIEMKEKCRSIFNKGKHSLHMSDYTEDTFRICSSLLNNNSIHFLNNGTNDISNNTKSLLINYYNKLGENNEDYCLTSSLIMEMYGLRTAKDIDYLQKDDIRLNIQDVGLHNGIWERYYGIHKDEIIYNPNNYFYINGYKFATLDIIKKMKTNRGEPKDLQDLKLIG
jgi:GR25 family glycosyltransferase involved in LPS biosynthesis